jgi:hypothetical protein
MMKLTRMKWARDVARTEEKWDACRKGKKESLGRPRRRWKIILSWI